jgi:hypothetical protein
LREGPVVASQAATHFALSHDRSFWHQNDVNDAVSRKAPAGARITVALQPAQVAALDAWIAGYDDPGISRPEAIRLLMRMGLSDRRRGPREPA